MKRVPPGGSGRVGNRAIAEEEIYERSRWRRCKGGGACQRSFWERLLRQTWEEAAIEQGFLQAGSCRGAPSMRIFLGATAADMTVAQRAAARAAVPRAARALSCRRGRRRGSGGAYEFVMACTVGSGGSEGRGALCALLAQLQSGSVVPASPALACWLGQAAHSLSTTLARRKPAKGAGAAARREERGAAPAWKAFWALEHRTADAMVSDDENVM